MRIPQQAVTTPGVRGTDSTELNSWLDANVTVSRVRGATLTLQVATAGTPSPKGDNTIVMLHGFPESWYEWRHQIRDLAQRGYYVVAPNLPGFAGSDPLPQSAYSPYDAAREIDGLLANMGIDRMTLVAHDWGSVVANCMATDARAQKRIKALCVMNSVYLPSMLQRFLDSADQRKCSQYILGLGSPMGPQIVRNEDFKVLRAALASTAVKGAYDALAIDRQMDAYRAPGVVEGALAYYRGALAIPGVLEALKGDVETAKRKMDEALREHPLPQAVPFEGPVTMLRGDQDMATTLGAQLPPTEVMPHLNLIHFPDASHFTANEKPNEVTREILALASGVR